jgi:hypothetical protein
MSKRTAAILLVAALVGLGGWALAQSDPRSGPPKKAEGEPGAVRYAVSGSGAKAILVDVTTGKTWQLRESADGRTAAWLPLTRIDDPQQAAKWQAEQDGLRREPGQRAGAGGGDARGAAAPGEEEGYHVLPLRHARADGLTKVLQQLAAGKEGSSARVVADERTNSLVLRGSRRQVEAAMNLARELDLPGAGGQGEQKKP